MTQGKIPLRTLCLLCLIVVIDGTDVPPPVYNLQMTSPERLTVVDESTLIHHAANGDAAAWEVLMNAHQEAAFRFAYLLLGDPDDAEDIAQESFLRA